MAVLWEDVGWPDLEEFLRTDDRAIVPVGSCEQHGRHLSFATDYLIPTEIARRVSARTRVPVTPPLCFGMSIHHMDFPGSITLSPDTFTAVVRDIVESLHRHGFRRLLILNGHGGNIATLAIRPNIPRLERAAHSAWQNGIEVMGPRHWKGLFPHGATGADPKGASAEIGERLLRAATDRFASELGQWDPIAPR